MEIHQRRLAPTAGLALEDELEQAHHSYPPTAHRRHSKPTLWGPKPAGRTLAVYVALLLAYGALCWLVSTYSARVPEPVPAGAPPQLFSEGRARLHLEQLIKQIGWRMTISPPLPFHVVWCRAVRAVWFSRFRETCVQPSLTVGALCDVQAKLARETTTSSR